MWPTSLVFLVLHVASLVAEVGGDDFEHLGLEFAVGVDNVPDAVFAQHTALEVGGQAAGLAVGKILLPVVGSEVVVDDFDRLHGLSVDVECLAQCINSL